MLTPQEKARYSRHLLIPGVGEAGQLRLKNASVLLIGTGGLGSPAALYLAAAGIGRLGLIDPDTVDLSNLQRQLLRGLGQPPPLRLARRQGPGDQKCDRHHGPIAVDGEGA